MKKVRFLSAAALLFTLGLGNAAFAQPGGYGAGRYPQPVPENRQAPVVAQAPVIIIDADGRRNNDRNYSRFDAQQQFDKRQRQRLEKRYGFAPPLVMFVPERFVNRYGDYVSQAGLVYHRGRDGYFHLDNRYYNDRWDDYSYNDNRYNSNDRRWNDNRRY